jgi:hypothetical protein
MAWLTGWSNRKAITLSRASGAVTNYQLKLLVGESSGSVGEDVDLGGLCLSSFDDLRFTTSDGTTLLDYYIESITGVNPNQLATVWIEFDSIGTGATTFYMYYGNSGASAASNGPNTFILFEDFNALNNGDLNGQNGWSGHTAWDVATATKYEGAKAAQSAAGGTTVNVSKSISSGGSGWRLFVQARMRHSIVSVTNGLDIYLYEGISAISAIAISSSQFKALVSPPSWVGIGKAAGNDTWYKALLCIDSVSTHKTWVDDTQYSPSNQSNMINAVTAINKIQLEQYSAGGTAFVDQIMVGYYLPTAPAWGSWGSTELSPTTPPPTTLAPTTLTPTTLLPTTLAPTTILPTTVLPTTLAATTLLPTTLLPTTLLPTTLAPSLGVLIGGKLVNKSILFGRLVQ